MNISTLFVMLGLCATVAIEAQAETKTEKKEDAAAVAEVKGDAAAGAGKVEVCVACHGAGGGAPIAPIYPNIAGQSVEYLSNALLAYRGGLRQGGMSAMMSPQVATLSDQDLADIAAYFSQQQRCAEPKQSAAAPVSNAQAQSVKR